MKKNEIVVKNLYTQDSKSFYKLILNGKYEKEVSISGRDCEIYRCDARDAIYRRVFEEASNLGISEENLEIIIL
jgi:hypothetical protein